MNNELSHLHRLSSVFSDRLDTPQALLLVGQSYKAVYEILTCKTPSERHGKKGYVDYCYAYSHIGIPANLISCDDTGVGSQIN